MKTKKELKLSSFLTFGLLGICVFGTFGIALRMIVLTGQTFKITIPEGAGGIVEAYPFGWISYLDWIFLSISIFTVATLFIRERRLRLGDKWLK